MAQAQPFEKDLGYLDRFLEKLSTHADTLLERATGERLAALLDAERARWAEIRGILSGTHPAPEGEGQAPEGDAAEGQAAATGQVPAGGEGAAAVGAAPEPTPSRDARVAEAPAAGSWTVGPLHG